MVVEKDWQRGIKETDAAVERAKHARKDIAEINAILDELFPEAEQDRKPDPPKMNQRRYQDRQA